MQSRLVRFTSLALVLSVVVLSGGRTISAAPFAAQTVYLHQGIEGFHRIAIQGELDGAGTVSFDPNSCSVNEFGDTVICTLIAPTVVPITLKDTQKADPDGLGRKLYLLDGAGLQNPLFIVVWPTADHPPRLIYNHRGEQAPVPITLEPLATAEVARAAPDLQKCAGQYTASQIPGAVLVFAAGAHSTAGYQTFLDELPITVFPPEFQLLHIAPTGPAAQVVTPFLVYTQFPAEQKVERVIVHDATGRHEVEVEQVPELH